MIWGVFYIGVWNFFVVEGSIGKLGIEIYGVVWYLLWDQSLEENQVEFKDKFLFDEDYQVVVEIINFFLQVLEDCKDGGCGFLSLEDELV